MEIDTKGSENKSKNKNDETYDAHSHIGTDTFIEREGNVSTYLKTAEKLHVTTSNIMPVPCPTYKTSKGTTQALRWEGVPSGFRYFRKTLSESGTVVLMSGGDLDCARYHVLAAKPWLVFTSKGNNISVAADDQNISIESEPLDILNNILIRISPGEYRIEPLYVEVINEMQE